ncbi:hypothetical protein C436_05470 [Haloarcula marismortui ATCC 33800]|uniref:AAA+ ATPase domain-containing protein n=1 Tax=Haloarcula marismortui ATCC 33800 TaxID=662476 RepID=M0K4X9_9EURY|nr:hypothetical protein C436_05470 [Haloarcula sinaiiensis ATCC 33800]
MSVDFVDSVEGDLTGVTQDASVLGQRFQELDSHRGELEDKIESLERSLKLDDGGSMQNVVESRLRSAYNELEDVESEMDDIVSRIEFLNSLMGEWREKGYGVSVCFSVATSFELVDESDFETVVGRQLQELKERCDRSIKQKLTGENFRLSIQELDTPFQLFQHLYTPLIHPENDLGEDYLKEMLAFYMAYSSEDLEVGEAVREESSVAAARSMNAVLQHLESGQGGSVSSVESTGPLIGNVNGSSMAFGLDLAEQPHYYIVGATGSGKSYTKRVLLENCLSMGYNVVSVTPRDLQALSAFQAFDKDGTGLTGDYYLPGNDLLLDKPSRWENFFAGSSFVSLRELGPSDSSEFVGEMFDAAAKLGQTDSPVFIFLDEAHLFSTGEVAESIQKAVREVRKFGVHVVLVTQSPMDFNRKYKHIRENTVGNFFLQGEYWDYAKKYLNRESDITDLGQGEAWFSGRGFSPVQLSIRKPLSRVAEVTKVELEELNKLYLSSTPSLEGEDSSIHADKEAESLDGDQEKVLKAIRRYIESEDELPSKNKVIDYSPFGSSKTPRLLSELKKMGFVGTESAERYGNEATVFKILK